MYALLSTLLSIAAAAYPLGEREVLHLHEIASCEPSSIVVRVTSPSGHAERRIFEIEGSILRRVRFTEEASGNTLDLILDKTFGDAVYLAPEPRAEEYAPQYRGLYLDFQAYAELCASEPIRKLRLKNHLPYVYGQPGPAVHFQWYEPVAVTPHAVAF